MPAAVDRIVVERAKPKPKPKQRQRRILHGIDVSKKPLYTVSEVAKFFFARSAHWIRWREKEGDLKLNGKQVGNGRTEGNARVYTLVDVENMAHALMRNNAIDLDQLDYALALVEAEARLYDYL